MPQEWQVDDSIILSLLPHTFSSEVTAELASLNSIKQKRNSFLIPDSSAYCLSFLIFIILLLLPHTFSSAYCFSLLELIRYLKGLPFSYLLFCLLPQLIFIRSCCLFLIPSLILTEVQPSCNHHIVTSSSHLLFCSLIQLRYTHHIVTSSSYLLFCLLLQLPYIHHLVSFLLIPSPLLTDSAFLYTHHLVIPFSYLLFCLLPQLPYIHHLVASSSYHLFCLLLQPKLEFINLPFLSHTFSSAYCLSFLIFIILSLLPHTFSSADCFSLLELINLSLLSHTFSSAYWLSFLIFRGDLVASSPYLLFCLLQSAFL